MIIDSICSDLDANQFTQDILNHIVLDRASCLRSKSSCKDHNQFIWHDNLLLKKKTVLYVPNGHLNSESYKIALTCQWLGILKPPSL